MPWTGDLVERAKSGDESAFASLYRCFARAVHGVVLGHVEHQEAEDVTQEVFVEVYRRIDSLRDADAFPSWIRALARNTAIDHSRRRQRAPQVASMSEEPAAEESGDGELAERVLALVRRLPEAFRESLILRLVEGLTGPEIAERTGMTHGSVRVNLTRGMAILRPMLRKEGWHEHQES